jgi:hypothetical protein
MTKVTIKATDEEIRVTVKDALGTKLQKKYEIPAMLTGSDVAELLEACGITVKYTYKQIH